MEINLDVYKGVFEHSKETFKLCGWYTDSENELATGYISHDKINELNLEKGSYTLLFSQSNHLSRSKIEEKFISDITDEERRTEDIRFLIQHNILLFLNYQVDMSW